MGWKISTFNVNGIRARLPIVLTWLTKHDPDVMCLQEIKCQNKDFPFEAFKKIGYVASVRGQKAFNGVAILSRTEPDRVEQRFDDGREGAEARFICAKFSDVWIINIYVPQGREPSDPAFEYKIDFLLHLKKWFASHFHPDQKIIWTGDMNIAPEPIDVFDPAGMEGQVGFHPKERFTLGKVISWGFVDIFRKHHPRRKQFTFWDYRLPNSFRRNLGWRLDHIYATRPLADISVACEVDAEPRRMPKPSDHTPVWAEFNL